MTLFCFKWQLERLWWNWIWYKHISDLKSYITYHRFTSLSNTKVKDLCKYEAIFFSVNAKQTSTIFSMNLFYWFKQCCSSTLHRLYVFGFFWKKTKEHLKDIIHWDITKLFSCLATCFITKSYFSQIYQTLNLLLLQWI